MDEEGTSSDEERSHMQTKRPELTKKKQLISAAVTVFAKYGFDTTTVDDIAKKAGIAKGTVYYHFNSKEEVFLAIVEEGIEQFRDIVKQKTAHIEDPVKKMEQLIKIQIAYVVEYHEFFKVLLSQWWSMETRWSKNTRVIGRTYFSITEDIISHGQQIGKFTKDINPDAAAMGLFWLVTTSTMNFVEYKQTYSLQSLEQTMHRLVLHALKP